MSMRDEPMDAQSGLPLDNENPFDADGPVWPPRGPADVVEVLLASLPLEIELGITIDSPDDADWPCTAELVLPDGRRFALFCAELPARLAASDALESEG